MSMPTLHLSEPVMALHREGYSLREIAARTAVPAAAVIRALQLDPNLLDRPAEEAGIERLTPERGRKQRR